VNRGTIGVNSLPKTVTRQRRGCDLNPSPFASESTRLPSHHNLKYVWIILLKSGFFGFPEVKLLHVIDEVDKCVRCLCEILNNIKID